MHTLTDLFAHLDQDPRDGEEAPRQEFKTAEAARRFIFGGKAKVTVRSKKTGTRFTFRIQAKDDGKIFFVSLLTGSNNEADYRYMGHIFNDGHHTYRHGRKSKIDESAPGAVAFRWVYAQILKGNMPEQLEVWHEGSCGRCGRTLTVPESIATGFGPECAGKVGL
jgi:hypothetical protein